MKKSELIKELNSIKGDFDIVCAKDPEGNDFTLLDELSMSFYKDNDERYLELYEEEDIEDFENKKQCIIIWPN